MNKKGFTLIELLATIVLIMLISILVVPSVVDILNNSKSSAQQIQINTILNAAYDLSFKNTSLLPDEDNSTYLTLAQLKNYGYVDSNITNPKTMELFSDDLVINIKNVGARYKNSDKNSIHKGNYLYSINLNSYGPNYNQKRPSIIILGLTPDSEGNYFTEVNIGETYVNDNYNATSYNNLDLTNSVIINLTVDDMFVNEIDTTKLGIYKISYTVIDNYGYSNTVVHSVAVVDKDAPQINFPESTTISLSTTQYNLKSDVYCIDNSGDCNITYEGDLDFGKVGTYVITYTSKDQSGNTVSKKRIITIE